MITGYKVSGHAGYSEEGSDIVCSAVSALTQAPLLGLEKHLKLNPSYVVNQEDGIFEVALNSAPTDLAPESVTLKASKLNITSLTIPLLLEWQPKKRSSEFFLSAGVVGVIKTCSSSKIVYNDASGKKHKEKMDSGMNIRPVTMDFLFQAGWDWIGLYAKYSPIDLFDSGS